MHELSLVNQIIQIVEEQLKQVARPNPPVRQTKVHSVCLEVGALSCVQAESLHFCYNLAVEGTHLQGSVLSIREVPVVVYCPSCLREFQLAGVQELGCPECGGSKTEIRHGMELDILSIELSEEEYYGTAHSGSSNQDPQEE